MDRIKEKTLNELAMALMCAAADYRMKLRENGLILSQEDIQLMSVVLDYSLKGTAYEINECLLNSKPTDN